MEIKEQESTATRPMEASDNGSLYAQGLSKSYGKNQAVAGIDIHVKAGEIVGLLGPNGAGKSTSFYMMVGMMQPTSGNVCIGDTDITKYPMHKRARMGISYLPQEASVFRKLSVRQNLTAIAEVLPLSKANQKEIVEQNLERLNLTSVSSQKAFTLSGGERRRLEIARALLCNPTFLLMDEPFSGVDPISVEGVQEMIKDLAHRGIGILLTDHNVRATLRVVNRASLIYEGKILAEGDREFLVNDPQCQSIYLGKEFVES